MLCIAFERRVANVPRGNGGSALELHQGVGDDLCWGLASGESNVGGTHRPSIPRELNEAAFLRWRMHRAAQNEERLQFAPLLVDYSLVLANRMGKPVDTNVERNDRLVSASPTSANTTRSKHLLERGFLG